MGLFLLSVKFVIIVLLLVDANFFANNKMSIRANNINEIVDATKKLLSDKMLREELMINQRKLINKYSAKSLIEYVLKYMNDEEVL